MKHFLSLLDFSSEELTGILNRADFLSKAWKENTMPQSLKNKQIGLWFYGNGFRNRLAFEIGARAMGAAVSYLPGELGVEEPLMDIGHFLRIGTRVSWSEPKSIKTWSIYPIISASR
ncbi:MAG TPA: hypothetical protein VHY08_24575 [Bacillota bacterium]|nr:hypothetical protein [Bacillota bacterium]